MRFECEEGWAGGKWVCYVTTGLTCESLAREGPCDDVLTMYKVWGTFEHAKACTMGAF